MKKSLLLGATVASLVALSACNDSSPKCGDTDTLNTLKKLVHKNHLASQNLDIYYDNVIYTSKIFHYIMEYNSVPPENSDDYDVFNIISEKQLDNKKGWVCRASIKGKITDKISRDFKDRFYKQWDVWVKLNNSNDLTYTGKDQFAIAEIFKENWDKVSIAYEDNDSISYTVQSTDDGNTIVSVKRR